MAMRPPKFFKVGLIMGEQIHHLLDRSLFLRKPLMGKASLYPELYVDQFTTIKTYPHAMESP
jgi:hypothetical protein